MDIFAFFQDTPPVISQPQGTDWVQLATTIGGFLVTIIGMILTYLKANKAVATAQITHANQEALALANTVILKQIQTSKDGIPRAIPTQGKPLDSSSIPSNP